MEVCNCPACKKKRSKEFVHRPCSCNGTKCWGKIVCLECEKTIHGYFGCDCGHSLREALTYLKENKPEDYERWRLTVAAVSKHKKK